MTRLAFDLNGAPLELTVDPAERLLDLLRYRLGLPGSKEGCGEGECGACTVYLDGLPVNACLVPAHQAHGHAVTTVEALDPAALGPFLRTGATQCGACTPGVVMTGSWIVSNRGILESHSIREAMAGNLCRCTGYDGIIEGIEAALEEGPASASPIAGTRITAVRALPLEAAAVRGEGAVLRPDTLAEVIAMRSDEPSAVLLAGGTDLFVHWPGRHEAHGRTYIDLTGVSRLRDREWTQDALILGAGTTYWDVVRDPRIADEFPLLIDAARQVGSIQIQTRGTWAGNIANGSPAADGVPVLMAYDADVVLAGPDGSRSVPLTDFYAGYKEMRMAANELIEAIRLPRRPRSEQWFEKVGSRAAQAITKVGVAVARADGGPSPGWRVVANSVAPTVTRCRAVESRLDADGRLGSVEEVRAVLADDVAPIDDVRSTASYRANVLARLLSFRLGTAGAADR